MNEKFKKISEDEWVDVVKTRGPFFDLDWEKQLHINFPYLTLEHYKYNDYFFIRTMKIDSRVVPAPFSDGGDILSVKIGNKQIKISVFEEDFKKYFGKNSRVIISEKNADVELGAENSLLDFCVTLEDADTMLGKFRKTTRHILQKSLKKEISIESCGANNLRDAYVLYLKNIRTVKNLALPFEIFRFISVHPEHDIWVWKDFGKVCGVAVFMNTKEASHYFLSAANGSAKSFDAPHHLLWHAMKEYQKAGKKEMFLGGTRSDSSLITFKKGWRGDEIRLCEVGSGSEKEKTRSSYSRQLWKFIPICFLPRISKMLGKRFF